MKRYILLLIMVFIGLYSFADDISTTLIEQSARIDVLEKQVTNLEDINNKLLNSIYLTIGTFSLIVLAFIVVNVFVGIQTKKREIENIEYEMMNDLNIKIETLIETQKNDLVSILDQKNEKISKENNESIKTVSTSIIKLGRRLSEFKHEYLEFVNTMEIPNYKKFNNLIEMLEIDLKRELSFYIEETLDAIYDFVKLNEIDSDQASSIIGTFKKVPEEYVIRKDRIKSTIKIEA